MAYILPDSPLTSTPLTEEECVRSGGHCYERTGDMFMTNPPKHVEKCKHCGKGRIAIPQEPFTYRDWP